MLAALTLAASSDGGGEAEWRVNQDEAQASRMMTVAASVRRADAARAADGPTRLAYAAPSVPPMPAPSAPPPLPLALSTPSSGILACPEPDDGLRFEPAQGFVFDREQQAATMLNWLNHLRCLGGVNPLARDGRIDQAADGHALWSVEHGSNAHEQLPGKLAFTGVHPGDRIRARRYTAATWGEVLSRTGPLAKDAFDGLVAAIYHRFVMLNPQFTDAGIALRPDPDGMVVSVVEFGAPRVRREQRLVPYPADAQREVPIAFDTDGEIPDPALDLGVTGYPVSLQAERGSVLRLSNFSLHRTDDGLPVPVRVRAGAYTPASGAEPDAVLGRHEAFLLPIEPLALDTEYEARFEGHLDGQPVDRVWRFRTRPERPLAVAERERLAPGEWTRLRLDGCGARYWWSHTPGLEIKLVTGNWMQVRGRQPGRALLELRDGCGRAQRLEFRVG